MDDAHKTGRLADATRDAQSGPASRGDARGEQKAKGEDKANRYRAQLEIPQTHENKDERNF
jgi:hypothetical protein